MLLKLLNFSAENGDFIPLGLGLLNDVFELFVGDFIFITLTLDILFEILVWLSGLNVELVLHNLSFFDENVHHNVNFLSNMISLFLE